MNFSGLFWDYFIRAPCHQRTKPLVARLSSRPGRCVDVFAPLYVLTLHAQGLGGIGSSGSGGGSGLGSSGLSGMPYAPMGSVQSPLMMPMSGPSVSAASLGGIGQSRTNTSGIAFAPEDFPSLNRAAYVSIQCAGVVLL